MRKLFLFIALVLFLTTSGNAQRHFIYQHEIGANIGISNSQSDFIAKGPFDGKATINGISIEGTHYLHILPRRYGATAILKHTILKTSLAINISSFDNTSFGTGDRPLNNPPDYTYENTPNNILLGRLNAKTTIISLDNEFQFYYKDILKYLHKYNRYRSKRKTNPYIALGFGVNYVNATPEYDQEAIDNNAGGVNGYPDRYNASFIQEKNIIAISANFAFGARYQAGTNYDLVAQMGFKYFFSDWIDGLNPILDSNKINDFNTVISVGAIYHLF